MTTRNHNNRSEKQKGHVPDHSDDKGRQGNEENRAEGGGGAKSQGQGHPNNPKGQHQQSGHG